MKREIAIKILVKARSAVCGHAPKFYDKYKDKPHKILDEWIKEIGKAQWLDILKANKEISVEIGSLLADKANLAFRFMDWRDYENEHGQIVLAEREQLVEWISDAVIKDVGDRRG